MSDVKSDQKSRRAYVDKTARVELELEVKMCPLGGISCAECGYREYSDTHNCFLAHLIDVLEEFEG